MYKLKILLLIGLLLLGVITEPDSKKSSVISVALASSLALPVEQIKKKFEQRYDIDVQLIHASSGVLSAQILHSAPFDLFISADMNYPQKIYQERLAASAPEIITRGPLVLWSSIPINEESIEQQVKSESIRTVAIANPDLAPFGRAAVEWLWEQNLFTSVRSKLVFGENVAQVNRIIHSGAADLALTAGSAMHAPELRLTGNWRVLNSSQNPGIPHGALLLDRTNSSEPFNPEAQLFMDFLTSPAAGAIFQQFGYQNAETPI